ncbi:MAG TPA: glycosyltransferase family 4 protein [Vicinamibacteria bacterium]|nr:glycosyltransferase family 4 protein [Vicinamibacteria bacterium]
MRVLMVTSSYPKFPGDVTAPFVESIALGVAARGHEVDVVLPAHPELRRGAAEPVRFFPYAYAPRPGWSRWGYAQSLRADIGVRGVAWLVAPLAALALRRAVAARLRERRYDAVHVHWVVPNAALVSDILAAHRARAVVSLHGSDVFVAERLLPARLLARRALARAGVVTACSADLRRRAVRLGAPPARTRVVPYGVDARLFSPAAPRAGIRERLGVPADAFLVLGLGRLVEKKGFSHLIDAVARLPGVHLAIAGEGDLRAELVARAQAAGVAAHFPGALEREAMAAALAAADVVAVPSVVDRAGNVDGLPNALLEALAAGKPVVASRVAGIPDVVEDGRNGLLVPEKDPVALADALLRVQREPHTRRALGDEARRRAERDLTWEAAARRFEECYAEAAALDAR